MPLDSGHKIVDLILICGILFYMTKNEFNAAFNIAKNFSVDLTNVDSSHMFGYGLPDFEPVHVTLEQVAKEIRWAALQFNGQWNGEALDEVAKLGRRNFIVLGA